MLNKIVITNDFSSLQLELENEFESKNLRFFISDDFLLENAKEVVNEAYIAEKEEKLLVIMAKNYKTEAQNSLLKIIEEPPRNVKFLIATNSKNLLLQTIRSRMIVENRLEKPKRMDINLNLKSLDLKDVMKFIDEYIELERSENFDKNELKSLISTVIIKACEAGFKFSADELEYFYKLMILADLNAKCTQLLTPLMLIILQKGRP
ncbi:DNA polymerase III subunit delta' [Campylobacter sp. RM9344]|uniref:DNA polymerase III subunit delta n=1 Tax=Campylobacter californiensis TaxID=1032243 RepID=A0AAW3ZW05_9BACT|nr:MULTISPECIES: DNA polymerase III subunit delta' [unclassified Campylobacter]MBE2984787.1 DNA polymerase III subunit delta' [Campylobacter sp. RM6883]MBE2986491.1 DNA polymerase III subunit delta' [Campylobacter sp. RM12919]MBE2987691.1 DNA polymerase III subunit delta' [Campylobacter sp. RM12920]MBE2994747.1 DNA polymerase III subunit delta' [Campylobacter sp. RM6913]MBE3022339.1 DNA polymerase III subunit delta' [Campylobacter sp. 7477a]MBE3029613.1 DNA polymerase III subunit delta' [Camp